MRIPYEVYLDKVLGGWIGKSVGGAIGARFEGNKTRIRISPDEMFPETMPPNDDLDLQVLWLKVLEERGAALTSEHLAEAWLEGCWYPFNEYGIFRRNWMLGIPPPFSGRYCNQFWETGMGCPIRAEVWGYVFPGAPDLAAEFAEKDGTLDHTEQSVGAEKMFAAMASMAFFVPDVRRLAAMFIHHLPEDTPIRRLTEAAFAAHDEGLSLADARERLMVLAGVPEACDSRVNVPFTFLGILYGENDLQKTLLAALECGYDTDCTLATAGALIGQILGAEGIPEAMKAPVGDELVMGIQYRRPEMTLTALARDTARVGVLLSRETATGVEIADAPDLAPFPATAKAPATRLEVEYFDLPAAAPGDLVDVTVRVVGEAPEGRLCVTPPVGWTVAPESAPVGPGQTSADFALAAPSDVREWPMRHLFAATLEATDGDTVAEYAFGVCGAGLWRLLGVYWDLEAGDDGPGVPKMHHHFASLKREYLPEPDPDVEGLYAEWSARLGQPALLASYEREVEVERLVGLKGAWVAYLARTVICPDDRDGQIYIGANDAFRLYVNGELAAESDATVCWAPDSFRPEVRLRKGPNELLLKLVKRREGTRFTLGFRDLRHDVDGFPRQDWMVDLADRAP